MCIPAAGLDLTYLTTTEFDVTPVVVCKLDSFSTLLAC